jgi:ABC-type transporter Mla MlaB component
MKTRKQKTPASKRARHRPAKRSAAQPRPAAAARGKPAPHRKATARGKAGARKAAAGHGNRALTEAASGGPVSQDGSLTLAAQCTVAEADALKSELMSRLHEPETVTVDVSALQRIDTAGLQLLAAFVRDRRTAGRAVAWRGRASALDSAAGLLGLYDMLELPREADR